MTSKGKAVVLYAGAIVGFLLILFFYGAPSVMILGLIVIADCAPTEAQIASGESCTQLADMIFWPVLIVLLAGFVLIQAVFLRWVFRKPAA